MLLAGLFTSSDNFQLHRAPFNLPFLCCTFISYLVVHNNKAYNVLFLELFILTLAHLDADFLVLKSIQPSVLERNIGNDKIYINKIQIF